MNQRSALLFINGVPPEKLPSPEGYALIACTDGAFHYLKEKKFPLLHLDFISGDYDSHDGYDEDVDQEKFIHTPDQNRTDFEKALEIIVDEGVTHVDVYGGSGAEMDHFLGNLTAAFRYKERLSITFYDEFSRYFFSPKNLVLNNMKGEIISLYPFPEAHHISTNGLNWELKDESLSQTGRIGTRNFAVADSVFLHFTKGDLIVFVANENAAGG